MRDALRFLGLCCLGKKKMAGKHAGKYKGGSRKGNKGAKRAKK
jgi:hypothetical protein